MALMTMSLGPPTVRMGRALLAALTVAVALAACGSGAISRLDGSRMPMNLSVSYVRACERGASAAFCRCVRRYVDARAASGVFARGQARLDRIGIFPRYWFEASRRCSAR